MLINFIFSFKCACGHASHPCVYTPFNFNFKNNRKLRPVAVAESLARLKHTCGESEISGNVYHGGLHQVQIRLSTLALKKETSPEVKKGVSVAP